MTWLGANVTWVRFLACCLGVMTRFKAIFLFRTDASGRRCPRLAGVADDADADGEPKQAGAYPHGRIGREVVRNVERHVGSTHGL